MDKLKVYMDNCCYSRPFDDLSQSKIMDEATAKLFIQSLVRYDSIDLYTSFILYHEINDNPNADTKEHVLDFVNEYSTVYISEDLEDEVTTLADEIMKTGIKKKDAVHLACSILAQCNFFVTTDKRVLKYITDKISIMNPVEFVEMWRKLP